MKNCSFCCLFLIKYYYYCLCNYFNEVVNGDVKIYNDESFLFGEEIESRLCEKFLVSVLDVEDFNFSMYVLFEDNLDKIEEEVDREEKSFI